MLEHIKARACMHQIGDSRRQHFDVGERVLVLRVAVRKQLAFLMISHTAGKSN